MLFDRKSASPAMPRTTDHERVSVSLTSLIDLAKPASGLNLHRLTVRARQSGGYLSPFRGRGMEFDETRLYQAGDDIRSIDWRVTARSGKTHTKLFREEREKPVFISVDNRASMQFATRGAFKSVQAKKLAALLAWTANRQGDRIGGQIFSDEYCREFKPQNGKHAVLHFLNGLTRAETTETGVMSLELVLARLSHHARPGSLVYLIGDFRGMNPLTENYLAKLAEHCDVVLIFVYDALEKSLPDRGRFRFTEDKSDSPREVVMDSGDRQTWIRYQQRFAERLQKIQQIARRQGMAMIQCSTQDDPVQRLLHPIEFR